MLNFSLYSDQDGDSRIKTPRKMLTYAIHTDMHALLRKRNERQGCCSADLPESPLDAIHGAQTPQFEEVYEPVRLIAGQDLGAARVLSFIA